jgi:uncharacterized protein YraI
MFGKKCFMAAGVIAAAFLVPVQVMAAFIAITSTALNLRVGPGTSYGIIAVIPQGHTVEVFGCLTDYSWCDVDWEGLRGWVAARYLLRPGDAVYLPAWAPAVGLPVVIFSFEIYHDRHYRKRPWHKRRHWHGRWGAEQKITRPDPRPSERHRDQRRTRQPRDVPDAIVRPKPETEQRRERRREPQIQRPRTEQGEKPRVKKRRAIPDVTGPNIEQRRERRPELQPERHRVDPAEKRRESLERSDVQHRERVSDDQDHSPGEQPRRRRFEAERPPTVE